MIVFMIVFIAITLKNIFAPSLGHTIKKHDLVTGGYRFLKIGMSKEDILANNPGISISLQSKPVYCYWDRIEAGSMSGLQEYCANAADLWLLEITDSEFCPEGSRHYLHLDFRGGLRIRRITMRCTVDS